MTSFNSWSNCDECGFQGLMEFHLREDENYDDPDALGVMMDCVCPACDGRESVLVVMEQYEEMLQMEKNVKASKAPRE
ncbi:MAG: hypothetical protein OER43_04915 [Gammaproteobacteria bacterium]|nr:hypothetical protein [Gammaproteobacteria bacterium]